MRIFLFTSSKIGVSQKSNDVTVLVTMLSKVTVWVQTGEDRVRVPVTVALLHVTLQADHAPYVNVYTGVTHAPRLQVYNLIKTHIQVFISYVSIYVQYIYDTIK
jgi:hypothetical protein